MLARLNDDDDLLQQTESMNYWTKKHFQVKNVGIEINNEKSLDSFLFCVGKMEIEMDTAEINYIVLHIERHPTNHDGFSCSAQFHNSISAEFFILCLWRKQIANNMNET